MDRSKQMIESLGLDEEELTGGIEEIYAEEVELITRTHYIYHQENPWKNFLNTLSLLEVKLFYDPTIARVSKITSGLIS